MNLWKCLGALSDWPGSLMLLVLDGFSSYYGQLPLSSKNVKGNSSSRSSCFLCPHHPCHPALGRGLGKGVEEVAWLEIGCLGWGIRGVAVFILMQKWFDTLGIIGSSTTDWDRRRNRARPSSLPECHQIRSHKVEGQKCCTCYPCPCKPWPLFTSKGQPGIRRRTEGRVGEGGVWLNFGRWNLLWSWPGKVEPSLVLTWSHLPQWVLHVYAAQQEGSHPSAPNVWEEKNKVWGTHTCSCLF